MSTGPAMPSPVEQVRQIRIILRQPYTNDFIVLSIRELLNEPEQRPAEEIEKDERGWPTFGTAWDRHDDPEQQP